MTTWTLILTLAMGIEGGVFIKEIDGFRSEQNCLSAGNLWVNMTNDKGVGRYGYRATAVCFQK